jgi:hydrogenase maturation protease
VTRTAILGIGSPFGDDRAGWLVIDALQVAVDARVLAGAGIHIAALDRPGAALLEHMRGFDCVVLVDAMRSGAPGTIIAIDLDELKTAGLWSSHALGVAEALALGATLDALPPEVLLFGIATGAGNLVERDLRAPVSEPVRRGALHLAAELAEALRAQTLGTTTAKPCPAPMHIAHNAYRPLMRSG